MSDKSVPVRPEFEYTDESNIDKIARKSKDNPMMPIGLAAFTGIAIYGIYKFKTRGHLSTSNYLMRLRVTAQGAVIGCLTLGVIKSLYDYTQKKDNSS